MITLQDLRNRRVEILTVAERHGARNLRVFGSVARGMANAESDVDLLVDMDPGRSYFDIFDLEQELAQLLGCRVEAATPGCISKHIRRSVERDLTPL